VDLIVEPDITRTTRSARPIQTAISPHTLYQYDAASRSSDAEPLPSQAPPALQEFLAKHIADSTHLYKGGVAAFKVLISTVEGYVSRGDVLERRLEGCDLILRTQSFVRPLEHIKSPETKVAKGNLHEVLSSGTLLGGLSLRNHDPTSAESVLSSVDTELQNRLSLQWLSPQALTRKRLAFVQGRTNPQSSIRMWETAHAVGISLFILDAEGHWLQQPQWAHLYEAFVPTDITPNEGLDDRLTAAVKAYPHKIDGIMTVSDVRLPGVAKAAHKLGFTTSPLEAYITAGDRYLTRKLKPSATESFECSSVEQLRARLTGSANASVKYPLIVKPCTGWGSECVTRASNANELVAAVGKAVGRHAGSTFAQACVVEPYIDGPEFDANFVLLEGEIVFAEVCDDYPSRADSGEAQHAGDFL
jgi:hypothetical protein